MKDDLELKRNRAGIVASYMNKEINKKKAELEKLTQGLYGAVAVMKKQIAKTHACDHQHRTVLGCG
jgi:hypothetical protein